MVFNKIADRNFLMRRLSMIGKLEICKLLKQTEMD